MLWGDGVGAAPQSLSGKKVYTQSQRFEGVGIGYLPVLYLSSI